MSELNRKYFGTVDYVLFGLTLISSSVIGLYLAYKSRKNTTSEEYLVANRSVNWLPLFVSMVATFFSAIGVMGVPAQIYSTGFTFVLHMFTFFIPVFLSAEIFTPMFRNLQLISVNEYLERRFSPSVRVLGCVLFHIQFLLYLSVALYAPSLALESVAGVPKYITIVSTGAVCTMYTTLGGIKAVIWTDVFQSSIMLVGLLATAIAGIIEVGSIKKIFEVAKQRERLSVNFSFDPRENHTVWGIMIGLVFSMMAQWTISQPTVQRAVAAKTLKDAKRALYASFGGLSVIMILLTLDAYIIFALYSECDLLKAKAITQNDQILPYFVVNKLGHIPGMPGLFTACLFSFALSTLSSGLNGMSALLLKDIVAKLKPRMTEKTATNISKISTLVYGCLITSLSFLVPYLGKYVIKLAIQLFGIVGGPYFSMFALGIFTKTGNKTGAIIGALSGFVVGVFFSVGQMIYPPDKQLTPISIRECSFFNATLSNSTGIIYPTAPTHTDGISNIFSISYLWFGMISLFVSLFIGYLTSICCQKRDDENKEINENLLFDYSRLNMLYCWRKIRRKKIKNGQLLEKPTDHQMDETMSI